MLLRSISRNGRSERREGTTLKTQPGIATVGFVACFIARVGGQRRHIGSRRKPRGRNRVWVRLWSTLVVPVQPFGGPVAIAPVHFVSSWPSPKSNAFHYFPLEMAPSLCPRSSHSLNVQTLITQTLFLSQLKGVREGWRIT